MPGKDPGGASIPKIFVGVDTGGTFTDIVLSDGRSTQNLKVPSTRDDPARAVLKGLAQLLGRRRADLLTYGTTVATNAMLERKGARTALVTTAGFEDVIEIGRQARPELYALEPRKVAVLVPPSLRFGLDERMLYDGKPEVAPSRAALGKLRRALEAKGAASVAVCLLHAHVNGRHEREVARELSRLGVPVTLSHDLCPSAGEFERTSTTAANAYVRPLIDSHIERLARGSRARVVRVMQSTGGAIGARTARREPVRTMLSGPAGGVAAALDCMPRQPIVSLDMGGTSTDVAYVAGQLPRRSVTDIGGLPLSTPSVDIHTVGAGGGSIASVDEGGALHVGPESAGADPGPACYGRATAATVTDANLVLGRLRPKAFLGGAMALEPERSWKALGALARRMGAGGPEEAAQGIVDVVEANMERAIRLITVERGQDPQTACLVAFGGAAALHACSLAETLAMSSVLVPASPGLLSARGMMGAPVVRDLTAALAIPDPDYEGLAAKARGLADKAARVAARDGVDADDIAVRCSVRLRYQGQSLELEVPLLPSFRRRFDDRHEQLFHYCDRSRPVEACGLTVTAEARRPLPLRRRRRSRARPSRARAQTRITVVSGGRRLTCPLYPRDALGRASRIHGPAVVTEYSSTLWLAPGWRASTREDGALELERTGGR